MTGPDLPLRTLAEKYAAAPVRIRPLRCRCGEPLINDMERERGACAGCGGVT
jgi:hypothetical protein